MTLRFTPRDSCCYPNPSGCVLLDQIHTIEKEVKQGKPGEACAELGKLANRIQKALTTKPPGLTGAQAHDFLKLVSAAKKTIGC